MDKNSIDARILQLVDKEDFRGLTQFIESNADQSDQCDMISLSIMIFISKDLYVNNQDCYRYFALINRGEEDAQLSRFFFILNYLLNMGSPSEYARVQLSESIFPYRSEFKTVITLKELTILANKELYAIINHILCFRNEMSIKYENDLGNTFLNYAIQARNLTLIKIIHANYKSADLTLSIIVLRDLLRDVDIGYLTYLCSTYAHLFNANNLNTCIIIMLYKMEPDETVKMLNRLASLHLRKKLFLHCMLDFKFIYVKYYLLKRYDILDLIDSLCVSKAAADSQKKRVEFGQIRIGCDSEMTICNAFQSNEFPCIVARLEKEYGAACFNVEDFFNAINYDAIGATTVLKKYFDDISSNTIKIRKIYNDAFRNKKYKVAQYINKTRTDIITPSKLNYGLYDVYEKVVSNRDYETAKFIESLHPKIYEQVLNDSTDSCPIMLLYILTTRKDINFNIETMANNRRLYTEYGSRILKATTINNTNYKSMAYVLIHSYNTTLLKEYKWLIVLAATRGNIVLPRKSNVCINNSLDADGDICMGALDGDEKCKINYNDDEVRSMIKHALEIQNLTFIQFAYYNLKWQACDYYTISYVFASNYLIDYEIYTFLFYARIIPFHVFEDLGEGDIVRNEWANKILRKAWYKRKIMKNLVSISAPYYDVGTSAYKRSKKEFDCVVEKLK